MASAAPSPAHPTRITPIEAHALLECGQAVAVDVRPPDLYAARHIPGARSIPLRQLGAQMATLPRDKTIIFY
ncbi:MAG TPA: rhodanese-like domain-containing protein [Chloroflexota bacterium]|nr:rhodanese-like domain-containing protein [Chloroflexota bacterium]